MIFLLVFFVFSIAFTVLLLKTQNEEVGLELALWKKVLLGVLGGLSGAIAAIVVVDPAVSAWCRELYSKGWQCNGGLGSLFVIFTVPFGAILGSGVSVLWTRWTIRVPATRPWASVFSYCGRNRALNIGIAIAVQAIYWTIFVWVMYLISLKLLQ
jgi:hypothetical protein